MTLCVVRSTTTFQVPNPSGYPHQVCGHRRLLDLTQFNPLDDEHIAASSARVVAEFSKR